MRISALYNDGTSNAYYRVLLPLAALEHRGHKVLWPARHPLEKALAGTPSWDVLHIQQFFNPNDADLVRRLRAEGIAVVWDSDDNILAIPKDSPAYKNYGGRRGPGGRRGLKRSFQWTVDIAKAASLMTTPSPYLADMYRDAGVEHVEVIENYVAPQHVGRPRPRHQGIVIGLTAAYEHIHDLAQLRIEETLRAVLEAHQRVRVVTYGLPLAIEHPRYVHRDHAPIEGLIAAEREFDIGLAPLVGSTFGLARSNVKVKEYAAAGAAWLASPVGPFSGLGEEQGGLLVPDGAWQATISELVVDDARRAALQERAIAWARRQTIQQGVVRWEAALRGAVERVRGGAGDG